MTKISQEVEYKDSPVPCPACGKEMHKKNWPKEAMPHVPKNAELVRRFMGLAMCRNAECSESSEQNPISWWYKRDI